MVGVKVKSHGRRKRPLKITVKGNFIRERVASPKDFDKRSFRTEKREKHRIVIACPKGHWHANRKEGEQCGVGTRAQVVLHPKSEMGKKFKRSGGKIRRVKK